MTIVIIQYFPKIVECRVAFSSNGSKYRHPIFSYSLHWKNVPFQWGSTNWPIGSEELGKSVARRCTVVYICNTPHLISRFNTFTQNQETNPPLSQAGQRLIFLNCQLEIYCILFCQSLWVIIYDSQFHNFQFSVKFLSLVRYYFVCVGVKFSKILWNLHFIWRYLYSIKGFYRLPDCGMPDRKLESVDDP